MGFYTDRVLPHLINAVMDNKQTRRIRRRVCADLSGEVVEIGFGTGHNLPFLPATVTFLHAIEPSGLGVELARERIASAPVPVEVVGLDGQRLPLPDESVDAALCTWTLCTIPDAVGAVREVRRVLKPGGRMHFVEHGASPDAGVRKWQDRLNGVQNRLAGGCNLNRHIVAILSEGGLKVERLDNYYGKGEPKPLGWMSEGIAVKG